MSWNVGRAKSRIREQLKTVPDVDRHVALDSAAVAQARAIEPNTAEHGVLGERRHLCG
jgi:hypothetical protein